MNAYDTVFADAKDEIDDFDVMFDREDSIIDSLVGCNEAGEPLTGSDECPAATAEERSDSDENEDYEKEIDASDSKDAPKDSEGTVGYEFEDEPEVGKKDDSTVPEPESPECDDEYQKESADEDDDIDDDILSDDEPSESCKESDGVGNVSVPSDDAMEDMEQTEDEEESCKEDYTADFDDEDDTESDDSDVEDATEDEEESCKEDYTADFDNEVDNGRVQEDPLDSADKDLSPESDDEYQNEAVDDIDNDIMDVVAPNGDDSDVEDDSVEFVEDEPAGEPDEDLSYDFEDEKIIDDVLNN